MRKKAKAVPGIIIGLIKSDPVLTAAFLLALISAFFVKPSAAYLGYIDYRVMALLLSLMLVVAGMKKAGLFTAVAVALLQKVGHTRALAALPVALCFFLSMLITNDVALITFVPFTVLLLSEAQEEKLLIPVIVLETVAANMGSCLTPLGNPQNLYLYSYTGMGAGEFMGIMAVPVICSFGLLLLCLLLVRKRELKQLPTVTEEPVAIKSAVLWCLLFVICILSVLRVIPYVRTLLAVVIAAAVTDFRLLKHADYGLLLTFLFFFIFIGNLKQMPLISEQLTALVAGRELFWGIFASQFISNVPAAMLLSGYARNFGGLLLGVNIGGLGTLIASMASLISYKFYAAGAKPQIGRYLLFFTAVNLLFLLIVTAVTVLLC